MKVILQNTQPLLGDRMMFTPLVRDLKALHPDWEIGVISVTKEVWLNNPHVSQVTNPDQTFNVGPGKVTRGSKTNGKHITEAFRCSLQEQLNERIPQGPFKADIHLSEKEKAQRIIDGHYWVINPDTKTMTAKRWPAECWAELISYFSDITFVQVGLKEDNTIKLEKPNLINLVGKTNIRQLFSLVYHAAGCISLVSSLMHVAGAFDKPCVVLAGGREPPTFERYANHRFLDTVGCLPCCAKQACWHNALSACEIPDNGYASCMRMIKPHNATEAVEMYYDGCVLGSTESHKPAKASPKIKIFTKSMAYGGAERSVVQIAKMFVEKNWIVELISTTGPNAQMFKDLPIEATWTNNVTGDCDMFLFYASDTVFDFHKPQYEIFGQLNAKRKVMALTYKIGKAAEAPWAKDWDKYLFLSSDLQNAFIEKAKIINDPHRTDYLAPCIDLKPFLAARPNYNKPLTILNHTSQGDKKHPQSILEIMDACINHNGTNFLFLPGPSWLKPSKNIDKYPPATTAKGVAAWLEQGNLYWYLLPAGYTDQGPRTIVEAMACGLPVIAERRDGAKDRVTKKTGWLIDSHEQAIEIINNVTVKELQEKGQAAKQRAREHFVPERWLNLIIGV